MITRGAPTGRGPYFVGLLGWPLDYTLSPAIHNAAFDAGGLDWVYLSWPVPPEALAAAVAGLRTLGGQGANVTIPHKESVVALVDQKSRDAAAVGAVNTIQRVGDRLVGHNTDVDGFREFVAGDAGIGISGKSALVIGAGGAARAVVHALADLGASHVSVCARDVERGSGVADLAGGRGGWVAWGERAAAAESADVIVNATPLGASGEALLPPSSLGPGKAVIDLVYRPPETPLVHAARAAGADAWGGIGMLVRQAAAAFRIWTGAPAPVEVMSAAALRAAADEPTDLRPLD